MNISELTAETFCPNCVLGVTGAVAKYKYNIANINRVCFHHSYVYGKKDKVSYDMESEGLNIWFSRDLPISKEDFSKRLLQYYGLGHRYKMYSVFGEIIQDILSASQSRELFAAEIDCYYMKKHRFYHKVHDSHMMIVYGVDFNKKRLNIFEPIFGHDVLEISEYKEYFDDVVNNINREVYALILVQKFHGDNQREDKINLQYFKEDIDKSLTNLSQLNNNTIGIGALKDFKTDLLDFIQNRKEVNKFYVPGMWTFMCDAMQGVNFIDEFRNDFFDFPKDNLDEVKKCCTILNRKWYYITMGINEVNRHKVSDFEKALDDIISTEEILQKKLTALKLDIVNYQ